MLVFLLKFLEFVLLLEEIFTGCIALLLEGLLLSKFRLGNAFLADLGSKVDIGVGQRKKGVLQAFEFLLGFVDLATQLITFPLQLFSFLRGLDNIVSLRVLSFSVL